jgi:hypothetical protein
MLPLGLSFFALSSQYKKNLLDEIFYLVKYANFNYSDILIMPTLERRYFIQKLIEVSTPKT